MLKVRGWGGFVVFGLTSIMAVFVAGAVEVVTTSYIPLSAYAIYILFWLAFWFPYLRESRLKIRFAIPAVFLMGMGFLLSPFDTRGAFLRHLYAVQPGMSAAQAGRIMGPYQLPDESVQEDNAYYKYENDATDPWYGDAGVVRFKHGRVESVEFSPD